ncbi:MAG TPA: hypothetical protein DCS93_20850 [Microscillaceae bacterium]|nr:hypothetical protein [Microscillaceae bacterium]
MINKTVVNIAGVLMIYLVSNFSAQAQTGPNGYNPNSVRGVKKLRPIFGKPIFEADVMYRTTVWRKINLQEKQNQPFFSRDREITQVIIDAVRAKKLQPYEFNSSPTSDGVSSPMEYDYFLSKLSYYDEAVGDTADFRATDLYLIELKEDLIFDRRTSRMKHDIQSITLVIPQGANAASQLADVRLATFKYQDLYAYFKEVYEASQTKGIFEAVRACWYNPENPRRHMSLGDALELRLFSSRIIKVSNPADDSIITIVNNEFKGEEQKNAQKVLYMSQTLEYDLMEYEHNLWEY